MRSSARLLAAGVVAIALLAAAFSGCVTSPGGSSGGGGGGGSRGGGSNPVVLIIDGREARADEVFKSPIFRTTLRQWAAIEHIKGRAAAEGVKVDPAEVQKKLEEQKSQMAQSGMEWDEMLRMQGMTEDEVLMMMEFQMMSEAYGKKMAGAITDEAVQKEWDDREGYWRDTYAAQNFLPESKKSELTFNEVKDWMKEQMVTQKAMTAQQTMFDDALKALELEIPSLGNAEEQKFWTNLIIKSAVADDEDEVVETPEGEGGEVPEIVIEGETPEAGAGEAPPAESEATPAPPAEGDAADGGR